MKVKAGITEKIYFLDQNLLQRETKSVVLRIIQVRFLQLVL